jgi:hypothetical protein
MAISSDSSTESLAMTRHAFALTTLFESVIVLSSCAVGYHRENIFGGYYEHAIDEKTYLVRFIGNCRNTQDELRDFAEYRAAEITIREGYTHYTLERPGPFGPDISRNHSVGFHVHLHGLGEEVERLPMNPLGRLELPQNAEQRIADLRRKYPRKFRNRSTTLKETELSESQFF